MNKKMNNENEGFQPNYDVECENCGQNPTVDDTELCSACCFGEHIDPTEWNK